MILTGPEIAKQVRAGKITISPFDENLLNPNSYNFRLGDLVRCYNDIPLDPRRHNNYLEYRLPADGLVLEQNFLYLVNTLEVMGSEHYAPTFAARSSIARLGLFINLSASLGDIGFVGQWTLQLYATNAIRVYPGMKIGQIMWWVPKGDIVLYRGKYQGSRGPQTSLIHRDFTP